MTARRAVVGLCMLCALAFTALAAQSASAATKGTTIDTCTNSGTFTTGASKFSDAHCKTVNAAGTFGHVEIKENEATELTGTNELTGGATEVTKLKATIAGVATEMQATGVHVVPGATITNKKAASGEHYVHAEGKLLYTGVTVVKPAGVGCKVTPAEIETQALTATTEGQGDFVKIQPKTGTLIATYTISGCTGEAFEPLNKEYKYEGSVGGVPSGATIKFTHSEVTASKTLKLNGTLIAGIEGTLTLKGKKVGGPEAPAALAATTIETP